MAGSRKMQWFWDSPRSGGDRRSAHRYSTQLACSFTLIEDGKSASEKLEGCLRDVSLEGGLLECATPIREGSRIVIDLSGVEVRAKVVRVERQPRRLFRKRTYMLCLKVPDSWPYDLFAQLAFPESGASRPQDDPYAEFFH